MNRKELEKQDNWLATFKRTLCRKGKFDCLMATVKGGCYWHTPEYKGLFLWGATRDFRLEMTASSIESGFLELVKGKLPAELKAALRNRKAVRANYARKHEETPMKVGELKKILELVPDDNDVVVRAESYSKGKRVGTVGPVSHVGVKSANKGFDWESGMFLISPDRELRFSRCPRA